MKHRIVFKQNRYYVQTRSWWTWNYERDGYVGIETSFIELKEAEEYIESKIQKNRGKFKIIKTY